MSEDIIKISALPRTTDPVNAADLLVLSKKDASGYDSYGITVDDLQAVIYKDVAYATTAAGVAATLVNQIFYVYTDATQNFVNKYLNKGNGSFTPFTYNGIIRKYPTAKCFETIDSVYGFGLSKLVDSYTALKALPVQVEGQRVRLASYASGTGLGGGEFIGHAGTKADDGGTIASGTNYYWQRVVNGPLTVQMFGAIGDGVNDDSYSFQKALLAANAKGGGSVYACTPPVNYRLTFPVFFFYNTELYGDGQMTKIIYENPFYNKGRGGFIMGSSVECGRDLAIAAYAAGTTATAAIRNDAFVNPTIQQYIRDNPSFVQSAGNSIHDLNMVATYQGAALNGGYAVNMCNAVNCNAYNLWGDGWTEIINFGSDTVPETPSTHNCHAWNITCVSPNQNKTFYSIGFAANSTGFSFKDCKQIAPLLAGTLNGSGIATNVCEDFTIEDIYIPNLGRSVTSEGILVNNSVNYLVNNIRIGNCITAVATYYTLAAMIDPLKWGHITNVHGSNCTNVLAVRGKYVVFSNYTGDNYTYDLFFGTSNASNNVIANEPRAIGFGGSTFPSTYLSNNDVKGWKYDYVYLRPLDLLVNDKVDLTSYDTNKTLSTKADVNLTLHTMIPTVFKAVSDVRCWLTFFNGSLSHTGGATTATISVRRMVAYDGNIGETPYVEFTNNRSSISDTTTDTSLVAQSTGTTPGYTLAADTTHGLANSLDLLITMTNNVAKNYMKEIRIGGYK